MSEPIALSEESPEFKEVKAAWEEEARGIETVEHLSDFIIKLMNDYNHDYGTIIHAMNAARLATFSVMNKSAQGGITGFQAGFIAWHDIGEFLGIAKDGDVGAKIVDYGKLLYPQYASDFAPTISDDVWENVQNKARELLANEGEAAYVHSAVVAHWKSIADGVVPFGLTVEKTL